MSHLDLDVSGVVDVFLNKKTIITETARSLLGGEAKAFPAQRKKKLNEIDDSFRCATFTISTLWKKVLFMI